MSGAALVLHQFRFEQKVFWRSPAAVFFTVMFPVIFLLLFASLFGNERSTSSGSSPDLLRARRSSPSRSSRRRSSTSRCGSSRCARAVA